MAAFCTHAGYIWDQVGTWTVGGPESADSQTIWACRGCSARFLDSGGQITTLTFPPITLTFPLTGGGVGASPAATAEHRTPSAQADQDGRPPTPPPHRPRLFELYRHQDVSGVTGTGTVAWGVEWPDKTATLRWHGEHPATAVWPNVEEILAVHGHSGATVLRWLDGA